MPGAPPNPNLPGVAHGGAAEVAIVRAAATRWRISPQTLWGVYGTESNFGHNAVHSSAGACCYFQFMPATAAKYKVQRGKFTDEAYGAAHYLHDLGADDDPKSARTARALNAYNGNGGGSSTTDYVRNVIAHGGALDHIPVVGDTVDAAVAAFHAATDPLEALGKFFDLLGQSSTWFRVGKVVFGVVILGAGAIALVVAGGKEVSNTPVGRVAMKATPAGRIAGKVT